MSDETVRVPAALVAALREAREYWSPLPGEPLLDAVTALLDAAERPDEGETRRWIDGDYAKGFRDGAEEALLSAADDIDAQDQRATWYEDWLRRRAAEYRPAAPLSSPRRTRDEAQGVLLDAAEDVDLSAYYDPSPSGRVSLSCREAERRVELWLRDRAARLAGEDDR